MAPVAGNNIGTKNTKRCYQKGYITGDKSAVEGKFSLFLCAKFLKPSFQTKNEEKYSLDLV